MFHDKGTPCKLFDLDVENLKVVEIKKRLKALGLPVTGNKSELVERLQEAMISGKEACVESSSMEVSVVPDSADDSSANKLSDQLLDENMSSPLKEKDLSQETQDQTVSSAAAAPVPLKKRAVVQAAADEVVKPKKRLVLNRNSVPMPKLSVPDEASKVVSHTKIEMGKNEDPKVESEPAILDKSGSIKNVISLATQPKKVLSEAERAIMRAKRFNLPIHVPKPQKTLDPAKRMQIMQWKSNVAASTPLAPDYFTGAQVPNLEILKKRAERFGENVSGIVKQMEDQEKINKRKSKFGHDIGDIKAPGSDEQEKKKKRAERFGNLVKFL